MTRIWVGLQAKNNKVVVALVDVYNNVEVAVYLTHNEAAELKDRLAKYLEDEKKGVQQGSVNSPGGAPGSNKG